MGLTISMVAIQPCGQSQPGSQPFGGAETNNSSIHCFCSTARRQNGTTSASERPFLLFLFHSNPTASNSSLPTFPASVSAVFCASLGTFACDSITRLNQHPPRRSTNDNTEHWGVAQHTVLPRFAVNAKRTLAFAKRQKPAKSTKPAKRPRLVYYSVFPKTSRFCRLVIRYCTLPVFLSEYHQPSTLYLELNSTHCSHAWAQRNHPTARFPGPPPTATGLSLNSECLQRSASGSSSPPIAYPPPTGATSVFK
jgi:hypothetical protein